MRTKYPTVLLVLPAVALTSLIATAKVLADDTESSAKQSVLLQAGITHSAFLKPLNLNEIDKQIGSAQTGSNQTNSTQNGAYPDPSNDNKAQQYTPKINAPVVPVIPRPVGQTGVSKNQSKDRNPTNLTVKDPTSDLRKQMGNLSSVDRASAYQKLLNLSAQKSPQNKRQNSSQNDKLLTGETALIRHQDIKSVPTKQIKLKSTAQKFEIPSWLAGVWQRTQMTETKRTSLPSGKSEKVSGTSTAVVKDAFGTFQDKSGRIFQLFDAHSGIGQVDRGETMDVEHIFDYRLKVLDSKRVVVEAKAWHAQISKTDKRLITAYQDEEFNVYTLVSPGKLRTDSSVKVFDKSGKPLMLTQSVSSETRIVKP